MCETNTDLRKTSSTRIEEKSQMTWIQGYSTISGKELDYELVGKKMSSISIEEEDNMNSAINDSMMTPISSFERELFRFLDVSNGELLSIEIIPSFIEFMKNDHSLIQKMLLLEVISNFHKGRNLRRLYKSGLLDVLRPWLSLRTDPIDEAITEMTLDFLLHIWTNKLFISNYSFSIGKAIVKVRKTGNSINSGLAEKVQEKWTKLLNVDEKEEEKKPLSQPLIALPVHFQPTEHFSMIERATESIQADYISSLPLDAVARNTRSRRHNISEEEMDYRKRLRVSTAIHHESLSTDVQDKSKRLWGIRSKHVDKRSKFNLKRHQSNFRTNIRLSIRLQYSEDTAIMETRRQDVLTDNREYTLSCNPYFLDYVALYAGGFSKNIAKYTHIDIPNLISLHSSIRGRKVHSSDIQKALNYLETGYCGKVIKSYSSVFNKHNKLTHINSKTQFHQCEVLLVDA